MFLILEGGGLTKCLLIKKRARNASTAIKFSVRFRLQKIPRSNAEATLRIFGRGREISRDLTSYNAWRGKRIGGSPYKGIYFLPSLRPLSFPPLWSLWR